MPSARKAQPKPTVVTRSPARNGPKMRDEVISALLRLTALLMSAGGTISVTNERRAGLSKAVVKPPTRAAKNTATMLGSGWKARAARTNDWTMAMVWTTSRMVRLG
jgi:hypothetical protein